MLLHHAPKFGSKRIILASASPRRKAALDSMGLKFDVVPSTFSEDLDKSTFSHPSEYVNETAYRKALEVADKVRSQGKFDLLISADTIVVLGSQIIEKPSSREHAVQIIQSLSGNTHTVYTAVTLIIPTENESAPAIHRFVEETEVTFDVIPDQAIEAYVDTGIPMDKAGGYGIQEGTGGSMITGIKGCYWNVTGFPIHRFCKEVLTLIDAKLL